jgi:cathepsin B
MFARTVALLGAAAVVSGRATINDQKVVDAINAKAPLWKAGFSRRFHGQGTSDFKLLLGVNEDSAAAVQKLPVYNSSVRTEDLPDSFDSATNWPQCATVIGDIRDQSMCGCCWAFAGAEAASDRLCIDTKGTVAVPLSAQDICFNANRNGCGGGQITTPWSYISGAGAVTGGQFNNTYPLKGGNFCSDFSLPHCHHHGPQGSDPYPAEGTPGCPPQTSPKGPTACDSDASASHGNFKADKWTFAGGPSATSGEDGIMKAIFEGGPVETAFTVYADFANYVSGVYHHVSGSVDGGHAVRIVGWGVDSGTKYWKVANSWNPYWGENGYFRIKKGGNECGIEDGVTFSRAGAKWRNSAQ